jgi:hypothetical protein
MQRHQSSRQPHAFELVRAIANDNIQLAALLEVVSHHQDQDSLQLLQAAGATDAVLRDLSAPGPLIPVDLGGLMCRRLDEAQSKAVMLSRSAAINATMHPAEGGWCTHLAKAADEFAQACARLRMWIQDHAAAIGAMGAGVSA